MQEGTKQAKSRERRGTDWIQCSGCEESNVACDVVSKSEPEQRHSRVRLWGACLVPGHCSGGVKLYIYIYIHIYIYIYIYVIIWGID